MVLLKHAAWACLALSMILAPASAADEQSGDAADMQRTREQAVTKGIDYLRTKGQAADGSYSAASDPIGITALVTTAILRNGRSPQDPLVAKSLKYLEKFVQPDGGIYRPESGNKNYESCLAIACFAAANHDGQYDEMLKKADHYIKGLQWDESEQQKPSDINYGGAGYGRSKRPDLSNTSFLIDALKASGTGPDDEAMKKALIFVSRCQNLESEHNTTEFSSKVNDGGFYYTPAGGGGDPAGKTADGGLRSYASMTYAGLKSMIYAGLKPDDPRVKAATDWIRQHYDLESNPGLGDAGLYYYYDTYAKALNAMGQETFVDAAGHKHHWRDELSQALAKRQQSDGSWTNSNSRWLEGDPNLVTGYALLALSYCRPK
jgi:squalene-hopene/tetraprenyl-beta-curcumene cyclase